LTEKEYKYLLLGIEKKVSVIIPVYNAEEYLRQCLDSVVNQTLSEIEVICINDGSTDSSLEILKKYAKTDDRIIIINQQNHGAGGARNSGLDVARGEYLYFLDSDDWLELEAMEILYNHAKSGNLDILNFDRFRYDAVMNKKYAYTMYDKSQVPDVYSAENVPDIYKTTTPVPWNKLYKHSFIKEKKIRFQNLKTCNDVYFVYSALALAGRVAIMNKHLITWRMNHAESTTAKRGIYWENIFAVYKKLMNDLNSKFDKSTELKKSFHEKILDTICYEYCHTTEKKKFIDEAKITLPDEYILMFLKLIFKVTVIIPVYNTEKYLRQCLDSVVNQTLKEIEIICVNDGSTDNSLKILEEYAKNDERIIIVTQENQGQACARNIGIHEAKGEYISFIDSDDWIDLNFYKTLYTAARKQNADLARTSYKHWYSENIQVEDYTLGKIIKKRIEEKKDLDINDHSVVVWNAIYKTEWLRENKILFDISHSTTEDVLFTAKTTNLSHKSIPVFGSFYYYRRFLGKDKIAHSSVTGLYKIDNFIKVHNDTVSYINSATYPDKNSYITAYKKILWRFDDRFKSVAEIISNNEARKLFDAFVYVFNSCKYKSELQDESYYQYLLLKKFKKYLHKKRNPELIISLTSYPARIGVVNQAVETLLEQTKIADKVILWLSTSEFPNKEADLPQELLYLTDRGLTIEWIDEDIKSYKKLIYTLVKYPSSIIITVDDDNLYQRDLVEKLYASYKQDTKRIHCTRAHRIFLKNGSITPYCEWIKYENNSIIPSYLNFFTGVGGVLYPPKSLHKDVTKKDIFTKLSPLADDIWFWAMAIKKRTKINLVREASFKLSSIKGTQNDNALWRTNVDKNENDVQLSAVINYYPVVLKRIKREDMVNRISMKKTAIKGKIKQKIKGILKKVRTIIGKTRRKTVRILLGREFFANLVNLKQTNEIVINLQNTMPALIENLNKISQALNYLENHSIKAIENTVQTVNEQVQSVRDTVKATDDSVRSVKGSVYWMNEQMQSVKGSVLWVSEQVRSVKGSVQSVNEQVQSARAAIRATDDSVRSVKGSVYWMNEQMQSVKGSVYWMNEQMQSVKGSVYWMNEQMQSVKGSVLWVSEQVRSVKGSVQSVNEQVQSVKSNEQSSKKAIQNAVNDHGNKLFNALVRTTPKASLTTVVISLVEHCNLNCWGCDHCAPLAEKFFLDVNDFKKDIARLAQLSGSENVGTIKLMGGEPLLHPDILEFATIARKYFPESRIEITTNGILLLKQKNSFWENCHENNITIVATKYPIEINWDKITDKARSKQVAFEYYGTSETVLKTSNHVPFDLSGTRDTTINFMQCNHANYCRELYHGRLYTCTVIPHVKHFNKAFNKELAECEADSVDIYSVDGMKEILEYLSKPIPFCRYCNVLARTWGHPWQQSKKDIAEWSLS